MLIVVDGNAFLLAFHGLSCSAVFFHVVGNEPFTCYG